MTDDDQARAVDPPTAVPAVPDGTQPDDPYRIAIVLEVELEDPADIERELVWGDKVVDG